MSSQNTVEVVLCKYKNPQKLIPRFKLEIKVCGGWSILSEIYQFHDEPQASELNDIDH